MATPQDNKDLVCRFWQDAFGRSTLTVADEVLASDCKLRSADDTKVVDNPDGIKGVIELMHRALSEMHVIVKEQIAEGDKVVTFWEGSGNHTGGVADIIPTHQEVLLRGISISEVSENKIKDIVELSTFTFGKPIGAQKEMFFWSWWKRHLAQS